MTFPAAVATRGAVTFARYAVPPNAVVRAYWLGTAPAARVAPADFAAMVAARFAGQVGGCWDGLGEPGGAVPHHGFHVLAVYPWLRVLRAGPPGPARRGSGSRCTGTGSATCPRPVSSPRCAAARRTSSTSRIAALPPRLTEVSERSGRATAAFFDLPAMTEPLDGARR